MKNYKGASILLVLLTIPVLITLVAFVVNLAISYTVVEQAKSYSRLLSLSALEQYYEVVRDVNNQYDLGKVRVAFSEAVKNRINKLAKENRFTGYKDRQFLDFIFSWEVKPDSSKTKGGVMTLGTYYFETPDNVPECTEAPCFVPVQPNLLARDLKALNAVNAFKVEANYVDGLTMRLFSSFLGEPVKVIRTCAVSTAIKRNLMFVIDISGSSAAETHVRRYVPEQVETPEEGRGGYYAYSLCHISDPSYGACAAINPARPTDPATDCYSVDSGSVFNKYKDAARGQYCDWFHMSKYDPLQEDGNKHNGPPEIRPIGDTNPIRHYYRDFISNLGESQSMVEVTGPYNPGERELHLNPASLPSNDLVNSKFFLDHHTAPEPLTSIFKALSIGIDELVARRVPGDKAGYVFFERNLIWTRIVNLTKHSYYLKDIALNSRKKLKDSIGNIRDAYGIFPSGLPSEDNTDIYVSLKEAARQLIENKETLNGAPSIDGIIYIGDFLPNCVSKKYFNRTQCDAGCVGPSCLPNSVCEERDCADDYNHYSAAVAEIWDLIAEDFVPNNITFNVVLLGKQVGPHTMDILNPANNECLSETEARKVGADYVLGGNRTGKIPADMHGYYRNKSEDSPFFQAGRDAYEIVRATGGIFKPVLLKPLDCVSDTTCVNGKRREVSRTCQNTEEQLTKYLTDIVGTGNPFKIVNTDCDF